MSFEDLFNQDRVSRFELANSISLLSDKYDHFLLDICPRVGNSIIYQ